ncbi:MAG: pilus assembly protein PilM [Polynucleobacter sp.]|nr:pilus assembly protein PilM [Polynucleobacter sp.]
MNNPIQPLMRYFIDLLSKYSVKQEDVVGVDITPNFIRVAQLSEEKGRWILEKIGSKYVSDKASLTDIATNQDLYANQLRELVESAKLETPNVAISIPITSAIIRTVTLPLMSDEEIHSAIEYDSLWSNIIQLAEKLEEYSIFWQIIRRNASANTMELLFVASKLSEINQYVQIATKAGLNPVVVDVRCFAIRNSLKTQKLRSLNTTALIEFGPNENYVLIVTDDAPFIYDIYVSESDRSLIENGVPSGEAGERLYDRLSGQIRQAFRAYETKAGSNLIEKVLLVSPLSDVGELLAQMKKCLDGYQVELFDPTADLIVPENLQSKITADKNISVFSSSIGLATRKVDIFGYYKYVTGVNNVNLLPNRDTVRSSEKKKVLSKLGIKASGIAVAAFIGVTVVHQFFSAGTSDPEYQKAVRLEEDVRIKEAILAKLTAQKMRYNQMLQASNEFKSNQVSTYQMLSAISGVVPGGIWFTELAFDSPVTLVIKGDAVNDQVIVNLVDRLQALPMIAQASLNTMTTAPRSPTRKLVGGYKQFEVRCVLKLNTTPADLAKSPPKRI